MAKYTVTRSCGHDEIVNLIGKLKDRQWRLENVEPYRLCYECWQEQAERERRKQNEEATLANREAGLPALQGTEKQISWAETIRKKFADEGDTELQKVLEMATRQELAGEDLERFEGQFPLYQDAYRHILMDHTNAAWWIDNRHMSARRLISNAVAKLEDTQKQPPAEVIEQAKIEATVRPKEPVTETVAEIKVLDNTVEVSFPERRDDFWQIIKKQLKYEWFGNCWRRELSALNGTAADRAAETGHRLLAAGFVVRVYDAIIRQNAVDGEYEPEITRWVMGRTNGKYKGWFTISWPWGDDFYNAARAIPGSRWERPYVVVPPERFEEVLDFADMYGFGVSDNARRIADAARRAKEATLVAQVEPPVVQNGPIIVDGKPPVLEVPEVVDIDETLRD